jgi:hypothetical protein
VKLRFALVLLGAASLLGAQGASAQVSGCDVCHGKPELKRQLPSGRTQSLHVDRSELRASVHAAKNCADCHVDVLEIPHLKPPQPVNCANCHYQGNTVGAPQGDLYQKYKESVHGQAVVAGNPQAPTCQDCHGSHRIKSRLDPGNQLSPSATPKVCGRCHLEIYAQYRTSIHGVGLEAGNKDVPSCADCHSEHGIRSHLDAASSTYSANVSTTCSACHAAEGIVGKYGISTEQVEAYQESFHGVATKYGMRTVANCASCHGVHDIRPSGDPASAVNVANIPAMCGKCHPGANSNYAQGKIHVRPKDPRSGIVYYVSGFFKWLTIAVICALVAHILLDLLRQYRRRKAA